MPASSTRSAPTAAAAPRRASYSGDVAAVANALAAKPLKGKVLLANGKTIAKTIDGISLLGTVLDSDLNPGLAAELPGGRPRRAQREHAAAAAARLPARARRDHPVDRPQLRRCTSRPSAATARSRGRRRRRSRNASRFSNAAVAALPAGTFGPFGKWAYKFGNADTCLVLAQPGRRRRARPGAAARRAGAGDLAAGTTCARRPTALRPSSRASARASWSSSPASATARPPRTTRAARRRSCARSCSAATSPERAPARRRSSRRSRRFPPPGQAKPAKPLGPLQTYSIAARAIADAEAIWIGAAVGALPIPGIWGGKLTPGAREFTLTPLRDRTRRRRQREDPADLDVGCRCASRAR